MLSNDNSGSESSKGTERDVERSGRSGFFVLVPEG